MSMNNNMDYSSKLQKLTNRRGDGQFVNLQKSFSAESLSNIFSEKTLREKNILI